MFSILIKWIGHFDFAQCDKNVLGGISGFSVFCCGLWVVGCGLFEFLLNDRFGHFDFAQGDKNVLGELGEVGCLLWVVGCGGLWGFNAKKQRRKRIARKRI